MTNNEIKLNNLKEFELLEYDDMLYFAKDTDDYMIDYYGDVKDKETWKIFNFYNSNKKLIDIIRWENYDFVFGGWILILIDLNNKTNRQSYSFIPTLDWLQFVYGNAY